MGDLYVQYKQERRNNGHVNQLNAYNSLAKHVAIQFQLFKIGTTIIKNVDILMFYFCWNQTLRFIFLIGIYHPFVIISNHLKGL